MKVKLICHTPDPERLVAAAARVCYSADGFDEEMDKLTPERVDKFVHMLTEIGHESPIEHATFTFDIDGVSRSLLAQITRHRIASFSVRSQRYVKFDDFRFVVPPAIASNLEASAEYTRAMEECMAHYRSLTDILYRGHYEALLAEGLDEKTAAKQAEKTAIEDARFVLPNAAETRIMMTMNARSLYNFFRLRCCNRAQWEIRDLAWAMLREVRRVAPTLFANAGPACLTGACDQGRMSCKKMVEVRRRSETLCEK